MQSLRDGISVGSRVQVYGMKSVTPKKISARAAPISDSPGSGASTVAVAGLGGRTGSRGGEETSLNGRKGTAVKCSFDLFESDLLSQKIWAVKLDGDNGEIRKFKLANLEPELEEVEPEQKEEQEQEQEQEVNRGENGSGTDDTDDNGEEDYSPFSVTQKVQYSKSCNEIRTSNYMRALLTSNSLI